jgi:hypothetical protein
MQGIVVICDQLGVYMCHLRREISAHKKERKYVLMRTRLLCTVPLTNKHEINA